jgi:hypothetical protein
MAAMDNFNRPAGGDPRDHQPTEQFWPGPGVPPGGQGPGNDYPWPQPGPQGHPASGRRKTRRWTVGIALAALLAGGGVIAGASLADTTLTTAPAASTGTSGSGTAASAGGSAAAQGGGAPASQAALLDATLNAAGAPDAAVSTSAAGATSTGGPPAAAGTGAAATAPAVRRCAQLAKTARAARLSGAARAATARCRFIRRRIVRFFLLRGVDGQFSFRAADGTVRTLAYVRGVIQSVSNGTSIVVQAADGSSWTWQLVSTTVVRDGTGKISESSLAVGEQVWVGGPVVGGVKDARLIFARPPSG